MKLNNIRKITAPFFFAVFLLLNFTIVFNEALGVGVGGDLDFGSNFTVKNLKTTTPPTLPGDVATKLYVDNQVAGSPTLQTVTTNGNITTLTIQAASFLDNDNTAYFLNPATVYPGISIATAGRVGIGLTSPSLPLHVEGEGGANMRLEQSGAGTNFFDFNIDSSGNLDIFRGAAFSATILQANGHLGIGTVSPADEIYALDSAGSARITVETGAASGYAGFGVKRGAAADYFTGINAGSANDYVIYDNVAAQTRFVLTTSGNVGINQTGPAAKLTINNPVAFGKTGSATDAIYAYANNSTGAAISGEQGNASGYAGYFSGKTAFMDGNVGIGTAGPGARLDVADTLAAGSQFIRVGDDAFLSDIDVINTLSIRGIPDSTIATLELGSGGARISGGSTGNVGIGTASPLEKLHVAGGVHIEDWSITKTIVQLTNDVSGWDYFGITHWDAQSFTLSTKSKIETVELKLNRTAGATAAPFQVGIRQMSGGVPSGLDICFSSIDGGTIDVLGFVWYTFSFISCEISTPGQYALVARVPGAGGTLTYGWDVGSNIATETAHLSIDSGSTWTIEASNDFMFKINGKEFITTKIVNGNVGIGTAGPGARLDVADTLAAGSQFIRVGDDAFLSDIDVINTLSIRGIPDSTIATLELGSGGARISGGSTGNVGIGTASPSTALDVAGGIRASGMSSLTQQSWQTPTFQGTWINYGAPYNSAGYFKDSLGIVHLRGLVKGGAMSGCIFTLPAEYRPQNRELHSTISNDVIGRVDIETSGCVVPFQGSTVWFTIDGVTFRAAP